MRDVLLIKHMKNESVLNSVGWSNDVSFKGNDEIKLYQTELEDTNRIVSESELKDSNKYILIKVKDVLEVRIIYRS